MDDVPALLLWLAGVLLGGGGLIGCRVRMLDDRRANYQNRKRVRDEVLSVIDKVILGETGNNDTADMIYKLAHVREEAAHFFRPSVVRQIALYAELVRELRKLNWRLDQNDLKADVDKWDEAFDRVTEIEDFFGPQHRQFKQLTHRQMNLNFWPWHDFITE